MHARARSIWETPLSRCPIRASIFPACSATQLRVHLETRDLNDFLPALGQNASAIPVKLQNGSVVFDGTASGKLDSLQAVGHLTATHPVYNDETLDSFTADIAASPNGVQLQNATAVRGPLRAQFRFNAALANWKTDPSGRDFRERDVA